MSGHHLPFEGRPAVAGDDALRDPDCKKAFIGEHALPGRELQDELPAAHLATDVLDLKTRLLLQLPYRRLFESLSCLNRAAGCGPIVPARERAFRMDEPEQQHSAGRVKQQKSG